MYLSSIYEYGWKLFINYEYSFIQNQKGFLQQVYTHVFKKRLMNVNYSRIHVQFQKLNVLLGCSTLSMVTELFFSKLVFFVNRLASADIDRRPIET